MKKRQLPEYIRGAIRADWEYTDMTIKEIASKYNISEATVKVWKKRKSTVRKKRVVKKMKTKKEVRDFLFKQCS